MEVLNIVSPETHFGSTEKDFGSKVDVIKASRRDHMKKKNTSFY